MAEGASPGLTAGAQLRQEMDSALHQASVAMGQPHDQPLEWTEQELVALEAACASADRREVLATAFSAELDAEMRSTVLVKLSAEMRALDRQVVDLLGKVNPGLGPAVSERHQKAAQARWGTSRRPRGISS